MRLFLAIAIPDRQAARLVGLQTGLPQARRVARENFHLTLAFLGDGSDREVDELDLALGAMRLDLPPVRLAGLDVFGGRAPRAIWVGAGPERALAALNARLATCARGAGVDLPRRRFVPHVTLARFREGTVTPEAVARVIEARGGFALEPFQPHALTLFRSHLRPEGPIYEALVDYPISASSV